MCAIFLSHFVFAVFWRTLVAFGFVFHHDWFCRLYINKFSFKSKDRIRNEKVYVVDTALATDKEGTIASDNLGWRLENVICVELLRRSKPLFHDLFYYKSASHEVDFVVADGGKPVELIQVSYDISSSKTRNRELNGLFVGAKDLKCEKLTLITFDTAETVSMNGHTIEIVPAIDWLCQR